ncbi:hypothetical protein EZS27_010065 [termite gut metagenome]|uniref:Uncharacterized protein n=1 Tax=termite gut metagenome TaxID=433724 RepID=A0A5J4S7V3_9ZZZZ
MENHTNTWKIVVYRIKKYCIYDCLCNTQHFINAAIYTVAFQYSFRLFIYFVGNKADTDMCLYSSRGKVEHYLQRPFGYAEGFLHWP